MANKQKDTSNNNQNTKNDCDSPKYKLDILKTNDNVLYEKYVRNEFKSMVIAGSIVAVSTSYTLDSIYPNISYIWKFAVGVPAVILATNAAGFIIKKHYNNLLRKENKNQ